MDNPATPDVDLDEDPPPYSADDAVADGEDHLAEQTDNSGEAEADDAPQEPDAVVDNDDEDDEGEEIDDGEPSSDQA